MTPAEQGPETSHHACAGEVCLRSASRRERHIGAYDADVRGGPHVQIVEVEDVSHRGPLTSLAQLSGDAVHGMRSARESHRDCVHERVAGERNIVVGGLESAPPLRQSLRQIHISSKYTYILFKCRAI